MKKLSAALCILSIIILSGCVKDINERTSLTPSEQSASNNQNQITDFAPGQNFVPNEMLVKFKKGISVSGRERALANVSGKVVEHIFTKAMKHFGDNEGLYLVHTPLDVNSGIGKMKGLAEVEYAEPNWIYQHIATSNDPYFTSGSLWGMDIGNGSQAVTAWTNNNTGNSNVVVGIIDEGAMWYHSDLSGNIKNPLEFGKTSGSDDDGNGHTDDIYGWDFDGNDNTPFDGKQDDHGTHVAGTVGAVGGNGTGVVGVCWNVTMISVKFLGRFGGTTSNAIKSVDYITDLKPKLTLAGYNLVATNNSWGGGGYSKGLHDAIARASLADILFIAAAGNDSKDIDASPTYPASYSFDETKEYVFSDNTKAYVKDNIIAVAALNSSGGKPSWSNWGKVSVDLAAPGVSIYSTLPGGRGKTITSTYGSYSGTSMATPHVTGAAAMYAAKYPLASAQDIKKAILDAAKSTQTSAFLHTGPSPVATEGRLNVSGF